MSKLGISAKKISDVVLVYDQYYAKKPNAVLLILERIGLCFALCFCSMMFLLVEYRFPVSGWLVTGLTLFFSAGFSLLFIFVKKRFVIPSVLLICAIIGHFSREEIMTKLSYFGDALWLLVDGRFIPGKLFVDHDLDMLNSQSLMYCEGTAFGFGLLVFLFTMITAACLVPKPHILPSMVLWIALWTPVLISETFTFSVWFIPTLALYMGSFVLASVYRQGIALSKGFSNNYREAVIRNERSFSNSLGRFSYTKQAEMRTVFYSKYFSTVMYTMSLFAALGIVAGGLFSKSDGIDYSKFYSFVRSIGEKSPLNSPFENGPASDWFASPIAGGETGVQSLSITNPGRGNQEILSVKNSGKSVVYLRGDIGIDFTGESWTSPVNNVPDEWEISELSEYYRPVELQVLKTLQGIFSSDPRLSSVSEADISVDYLCDTTVIFLPAYTKSVGYFDNEMFNFHGDFVARVDDSYERMGSVLCTALVPDYTNMDGSSSEYVPDSLRHAVAFTNTTGGIADIINSNYFEERSSAATDYKKYVYKTYLGVPPQYKLMIKEYIEDNGFWSKSLAFSEKNEIVKRYMLASEVANHLRNNYTYSLNTDNSGDNPLRSFLYETKSGHCAMYASSMTLILRDMGIPARYCTGFVASPNNGVATVLHSKNLHAWVEVYLDELGWVTFDPTSSSQTNIVPGGVSNPESNPVSLPDDEPSVDIGESNSDEEPKVSESEDEENSEESSDQSTGELPPDEEPKLNIVPYILISIGVVAVIILVILTFRAYKKLGERALAAIRKMRANGDAEVLLDKILVVMKLGGIKQKQGETPEKFYARAGNKFLCSINDYKDVLNEASFGNPDSMSDTDLARLAGLLERLYRDAEKRMTVLDKVELRLAILSRKKTR